MTEEELQNISNTDYFLNVKISDALSEVDKVKYTIHTKTDMPKFAKQEMSVVRTHEEFTWLYNILESNSDYIGHIIPPAPSRPNFNESRKKLQKLTDSKYLLQKKDFIKHKQGLEQEFLTTFKKSVAMHEIFLTRLANHPILKYDSNFRLFLEYENDLVIRTKNTKEVFGTFFKHVSQSANEIFFSGQRDIDEFFERKKNHLMDYYCHFRDITVKVDRVCNSHKEIADIYFKISTYVKKIGQIEDNFSNGNKNFEIFLQKVGDILERYNKAIIRVGKDQELKESDTFRYFSSELEASKNLLYRRLRYLNNCENAEKNLEKAVMHNNNVKKAVQEKKETCCKFYSISEKAKVELINLDKFRVETIEKNLFEFYDLMIKQSKWKLNILQLGLADLKEINIFA